MKDFKPIKRALVSVSDKQGIVQFVKELVKRDVQILSTGGTAKLLMEHNINVIEVSDYTKFPEMMDGRLKTLHPKIHGGILARRGIDDATLKEHGIETIDLVCVNLYPFSKTTANKDCTLEKAIENIDIGGPTMLRAAAKNHNDVAVVVNAKDYERIIKQMDEHQNCLSYETRFDLAIAAFEHTAAYDGAIANYFGKKVCDYTSAHELDDTFPRTLNLQYIKKQNMRYGENPHQKAAFYVNYDEQSPSISSAIQLQGKELSYNNIADADAAIECVREFTDPCCVIVKHANPCGVAIADDIHQAYINAFLSDSESAFGGIIAFNKTLDHKTASEIVNRQFCELIIAPAIEDNVIEDVLAAKKNIRVLITGDLTKNAPRFDYKRVNGGLLVQDADINSVKLEDLKVVTKTVPSEDDLNELLFAWKVCKYTKSNAIVYTNNKRTLGIGCGQTSRVFSAQIAQMRAANANLSLQGCALASDAFFPFKDSIDEAAKVGVKCIIQPGGSIRDQEVIEQCDKYNIAMVFTNMRHFRH